MSHRGKGRRQSKSSRTGSYDAQFRRTVHRTGKWRGQKTDVNGEGYIKYKKVKKKNGV